MSATRCQIKLCFGLPTTTDLPLSPPLRIAARSLRSSWPLGLSPLWHSRHRDASNERILVERWFDF